MKPILLAFLSVLVRAYPSALPLDNSENLFSTPSPEILNDGTLLSSIGSSEFESGGNSASNIFIFEGLIDNSVVAESSPVEDSTFDKPLTVESSENLFDDSNLSPGSSASIFSSDVITANSNIEQSSNNPTLGSFVTNSNCDGSSIGTDDLLAEYYPEEDTSADIFDPSVFAANPGDNLLVARLEGSEIPQIQPPTNPGRNKGTYVRPQVYTLPPNTGKYLRTYDAYAEDGTPIQPASCPAGKKRACCDPDAIPPFSRCWRGGQGPNSICAFAKNQFCCTSVEKAAGPGIDCDEAKWIKSRDGRQSLPNSGGENQPSTLDLQDLFPILQPLPPLTDPNPTWCKPRGRKL